MKPSLRSLRKNQQVWAIVEECLVQNEVIINFSGDLVRVKNQTDKNLRAGQRVLVLIEELHPLKLKLVSPKEQRRSSYPRSLDVEV
jgi:hypothetical protein